LSLSDLLLGFFDGFDESLRKSALPFLCARGFSITTLERDQLGYRDPSTTNSVLVVRKGCRPNDVQFVLAEELHTDGARLRPLLLF